MTNPDSSKTCPTCKGKLPSRAMINFKPDPSAPSYGSASGAMQVEGFKQGFEKRIAELKGEK